jgi:hypothetical protein
MWLLHRSPNILLIPGTSSVAHLCESQAAGQLTLKPETLTELETIASSAGGVEAPSQIVQSSSIFNGGRREKAGKPSATTRTSTIEGKARWEEADHPSSIPQSCSLSCSSSASSL